MQQDTAVTAMAHAIQLSVAPVFLLSGLLMFLREILIATATLDIGIKQAAVPPGRGD